ncbi:MAG: MFS transporter [Muribaculum sp.]|nr:MFS transporter [Muribaculum sp.]
MKLVSKKYAVPFVLITSLFFLWGFARAILDVLNKHFQEMLHISIGQSALIQATTYLGYFLMALPAGVMITRVGYRKGVVVGLMLFAIGSLLFIPGESMMSFGMFLTALFIIGCGLVILETAANPYAAELGDKETAASRLNLAQSFNGLGCILAPVIVGGFLFSTPGSSVSVPYGIMGVAVLIIAAIFSRVHLPEITSNNDNNDSTDNTDNNDNNDSNDNPDNNDSNDNPDNNDNNDNITGIIRRLWSSKRFRLGVLALFFYEIAEISINSLFINYATADGWMDKTTASVVLSFGALGLFMAARIIGSWVMSKIASEKVLLACGVMTVVGALLVVANIGWLSRAGVFICYAFEAIMFPTIFAITIVGVSGKAVKIASSFLMMTPIGGAVGTLLMGQMADLTSMSTAFIIPAIGYAFVLIYALNTYKNAQCTVHNAQ